MENKNKIICIDWSAFLFMSAHASITNGVQAPYLAMIMILGNLKKIGVNKEDIILVCCDYLKSWRKEYVPEYKANREEARKKSPVDFDTVFQEFNLLLDDVERGTNWNVIKTPNCLSGNARITTPDGYKHIKNIKPGDKVNSYNLKTQKYFLYL